MHPSSFIQLTKEQDLQFRAWAHKPENWEPGKPIDPLWHPVTRHECAVLDLLAHKHPNAIPQEG